MLVSVFSVLLFTSCTQSIYFPQHVNTTHFRHKDEAKIDISFKPPGDTKEDLWDVSPAVDAAYAVAGHIALIGSYHTITRNILPNTSDNLLSDTRRMGGLFSGHNLEAGGGYFTALGHTGTFEVLGGAGGGVVHRDSRDSSYEPSRLNFTTHYFNYFIQSAIGIRRHHAMFSAGLRLEGRRYTDFTSPNPDLKYAINHLGDTYYGYRDLTASNFLFLQHYLDMEVGGENIKFNLQLGTYVQCTGPKVSSDIPFYVTAGLVLYHFPHLGWH